MNNIVCDSCQNQQECSDLEKLLALLLFLDPEADDLDFVVFKQEMEGEVNYG